MPGLLKEAKNSYKNLKPGWQIQLEQQISSYRRRLAFVDLILKCKEQGAYTKHQRNSEQKLKRWCRKTSVENLNRVQTTLKEKFAASTQKLRRRKIVREREIINRKFLVNPKAVYRKFKADKGIDIMNPPSNEEIGSFWKNIWGTEQQYNKNTDWLLKLEKEYCKGIQPKTSELTIDILHKIFTKAANNKAPGREFFKPMHGYPNINTHIFLEYLNIFKRRMKLRCLYG